MKTIIPHKVKHRYTLGEIPSAMGTVIIHEAREGLVKKKKKIREELDLKTEYSFNRKK